MCRVLHFNLSFTVGMTLFCGSIPSYRIVIIEEYVQQERKRVGGHTSSIKLNQTDPCRTGSQAGGLGHLLQ